jgi:hypothetical protein
MMYLFAVRGKLQPGKVEEVSQKWKAFYDSRFKGMPEFQQAYYTADRATNTTLGVAVWSDKPDEAQLLAYVQEFISQISDLMAEPISPQWYEVLQQI